MRPFTRPLVGIPLGLDDRGRWRSDREYQYIDHAYVRAVTEGGGHAIHLPIQEQPEALVERLDGLLIPGGDDFAPPREYPGDVAFEPAPTRQIEFDRRVLSLALERELPVLAICYGMQLLALHSGGDLIYHIPTDLPGAHAHRLPESDGRHRIRLTADTRLAAALGPEPEPVNSLHHQGVADPGEGMLTSARAEDGLIEAIERETSQFCVGVQWHPEKMTGLHRERLFASFVAACAQRRTA